MGDKAGKRRTTAVGEAIGHDQEGDDFDFGSNSQRAAALREEADCVDFEEEERIIGMSPDFVDFDEEERIIGTDPDAIDFEEEEFVFASNDTASAREAEAERRAAADAHRGEDRARWLEEVEEDEGFSWLDTDQDLFGEEDTSSLGAVRRDAMERGAAQASADDHGWDTMFADGGAGGSEVFWDVGLAKYKDEDREIDLGRLQGNHGEWGEEGKDERHGTKASFTLAASKEEDGSDQIGTANLEASVGDDGATLGAALNVVSEDMQNTKDDGGKAYSHQDRHLRMGGGFGWGAAFRTHWDDRDGDNRPMYGWGADVGPLSLDYKSEDPISDMIPYSQLLTDDNLTHELIGPEEGEAFEGSDWKDKLRKPDAGKSIEGGDWKDKLRKD